MGPHHFVEVVVWMMCLTGPCPALLNGRKKSFMLRLMLRIARQDCSLREVLTGLIAVRWSSPNISPMSAAAHPA